MNNRGLSTTQPLSLRKTAFAMLICVLCMWVDNKNPNAFASLRSASHSFMQPIYQMSLVPNFTAHWTTDTLKTKEALRRENIQLKTELINAKAQLQQMDYLLAENARLQGILTTTRSDEFDLKLAKVVGTDSNPTKQVVVLDKGRKDGVRVGQTVIDEKGVMGQIINVYPDSSRLLLITDKEQSVSVYIKRNGQRAVVSGKGSPKELSLDYIFKTSDIRIGDELISSGMGGRVPAGYRVGRIARIDTQQTDNNYIDIDVTPIANFIDASYVLILQHKDD